VNKTELVEALAARAGLGKAEAARAVNALFGEGGILAGELKSGGRVQITGFGTFLARRRAARIGRNPRTGRVMQLPAVTLPSFRAGQTLKQELNRKRR
jgi:DNA-binding protein HU-beta